LGSFLSSIRKCIRLKKHVQLVKLPTHRQTKRVKFYSIESQNQVDFCCLIYFSFVTAVIRHRICFHRTRQTIIQLPLIVWSSTNRCHQEDWDIRLASKRYTHFWGGSVHFAEKYYHPIRVHKGSTLSCNTNEKRTVVFQFNKGEIMALTKTSIEKMSNGMKFIGRQLLLRLIFAGTVHRSQGMTLQRVVIDCHMKFWEHVQLYVALSGVKSPGDLCILLRDDMDDFTFAQPLTLILFKFSRWCNLPEPYQPPKFAWW
jgi:hypothetical protein